MQIKQNPSAAASWTCWTIIVRKAFFVNGIVMFSNTASLLISKIPSQKKEETLKDACVWYNYEFKSYSYFSWVKMVHPAHSASQGVSIFICQMMNGAKAITDEAAETGRGKVLWVRRIRNSFPGSAEAIWASCKTVAQRKEELFFFFLRPYAPVPHRSSPEWDMRSRDTACPSRAGVLPRLSITQTHRRTHTLAQTQIYTAVYTLQSHNATRFNAAAAQIGHLKPGRCILTLLTNFQWVKLKFYEYDRIRKHHWKKCKRAVSAAAFIHNSRPENNNIYRMVLQQRWPHPY